MVQGQECKGCVHHTDEGEGQVEHCNHATAPQNPEDLRIWLFYGNMGICRWATRERYKV